VPGHTKEAVATSCIAENQRPGPCLLHELSMDLGPGASLRGIPAEYGRAIRNAPGYGWSTRPTVMRSPGFSSGRGAACREKGDRVSTHAGGSGLLGRTSV
jgi:hypothetical protein